jgi:septum formation protein
MCARASGTQLPPLILASGSPRRAELLGRMGLEFQTVVSNAKEIHMGEITAPELARVNAYRKARAVAKKHPDALVIGADTLVYLDRVLFGKPAGLEEAYAMLETLGGRTHQVVTGMCLLHLREHRHRVFSDITEVTFRPIDAVAIQRYLIAVDPLDKAGAYAIQEHGDWIVERISGSFANVVGLPVELFARQLKEWGSPGARPKG